MSVIGKNFVISLFGQSHEKVIGVTIHGIAPGMQLDIELIKENLIKRRSTEELGTKRIEEDDFEIVSGYFKGVTTGDPLTFLIHNSEQNSEEYEKVFRPSHGDYTNYIKSQGNFDYRGGGHGSGRLTAPLVIAGSIALQILKSHNIIIGSRIVSVGKVVDNVDIKTINLENMIEKLNKEYIPVISSSLVEKIRDEIKLAEANDDSVGGILQTFVLNLEKGIGEPYFDSLESVISHSLFSIPSIKGVSFGLGFDFASYKGSEVNDQMSSKQTFLSNNNGGILGGISNGEPIVINTVFKPTPSIKKPQQTLNYNNEDTILNLNGRHDVTTIIRGRIVVESLLACAILDLIVQRHGYLWMTTI
jgi:chorismate synthase